jgi:hypothetical protein
MLAPLRASWLAYLQFGDAALRVARRLRKTL